MKWKRRGHEFDSFKEVWRDKTGEIIIYGINDFAADIMDKLFRANNQGARNLFFADDRLCGQELLGKTILNSEEAMPIMTDKSVITLFSERNAKTEWLKYRLRMEPMAENIDFFDIETFNSKYLPIYEFVLWDNVYVDFLGHVPNFKCTLRCKYCSVAIPYQKLKNPTVERLKKEIDLLFSKLIIFILMMRPVPKRLLFHQHLWRLYHIFLKTMGISLAIYILQPMQQLCQMMSCYQY